MHTIYLFTEFQYSSQTQKQNITSTVQRMAPQRSQRTLATVLLPQRRGFINEILNSVF
jgi:hypothetical protein